MTVVVDARGLPCPIPVIRLALAASDHAPGTEIEVWWTDPAAEQDIPAWARMRGHTVVVTGDQADETGASRVTRVRLAAPPPDQPPTAGGQELHDHAPGLR